MLLQPPPSPWQSVTGFARVRGIQVWELGPPSPLGHDAHHPSISRSFCGGHLVRKETSHLTLSPHCCCRCKSCCQLDSSHPLLLSAHRLDAMWDLKIPLVKRFFAESLDGEVPSYSVIVSWNLVKSAELDFVSPPWTEYSEFWAADATWLQSCSGWTSAPDGLLQLCGLRVNPWPFTAAWHSTNAVQGGLSTDGSPIQSQMCRPVSLGSQHPSLVDRAVRGCSAMPLSGSTIPTLPTCWEITRSQDDRDSSAYIFTRCKSCSSSI